MKNVINVKGLVKEYKVYKKQEGLLASVKGLFKREYKIVKAVADIDLQIEQGEMIGFIGSNGAGKTTTLKMLSGLLYPTRGNVEVLGAVPYQRKSAFLKEIALVMGQKNQLWWDLPAIETFRLNKKIYEVSDSEYEKVLKEFIELLDLKDVINKQVRKLSLGERMKCELVAALIHTPKILFLDEPTIGLDVVMQKRIRKFIREYNKKYKATVILTSHYMDDVKEICERIVVIDKGSIVFDDTLDELIVSHAGYKTVSVVFNNKNIKKQELEKFGDVQEFNFHKAVFKVDKNQVPKLASALLAKYDIDDIDINEPRLEDIVRQVFEN